MSDLHAMPITNITHNALYTVELSESARDLTRITFDNNHTSYKHICLQGIGCVCVKNYPPEIMQPSSSTRATIVSAENQNGATIVKATFFLLPLLHRIGIKWCRRSTRTILKWKSKIQMNPRRTVRLYEWYKATKNFAALSSPRPCWRWLQLQPSCGSPQWLFVGGMFHWPN